MIARWTSDHPEVAEWHEHCEEVPVVETYMDFLKGRKVKGRGMVLVHDGRHLYALEYTQSDKLARWGVWYQDVVAEEMAEELGVKLYYHEGEAMKALDLLCERERQ